MKKDSPSKIYETILSELNNLIHTLKIEIADDEIRTFQEDAQKQLVSVHRELHSALDSLQLNAEWDVFSIAFYGETNAGKSTLIETLRILLREPTKEKEREQFKAINDSILDIQNQINQLKNLLEQTINNYKPRVIEIEENIKAINLKQADTETQIDELNEKIHEIENQIEAKKKSNIINFFKALLRILKEQQEHQIFVEKNSNYKANILSYNNDKSELENLKELIQEEWDTKTKSIKASEEILENEIIQMSGELSKYCDGEIIGDGHSDFTRNVTTYQFKCNGQKFALLDLPGIEGKEDLVLNEIKDAVQKAHAVFYISSKPTPPQKGNLHCDGTLEKIEKHLGQQTEVYSIFNKRVKNYHQLQPGLINDDEKESLKELDTIMRDRLGEQYEKHIILSAYPAFLSIANCSQNNFEKSQKKFLEIFKSQERLLQASLVKNFSDWITMSLVKNCKLKIKRSNYKKISIALTRTINELNGIYIELYDLEKKLIKTKKAIDDQLDEAAEILKQQLDSSAYKAVDDFKTLLRKNIYCDIDKYQTNDEFKSAFECQVKKAIKMLSTSLEEKFDIIINEFRNDVAGIVEKYQRYTAELLNAYKSSSQFDFDFTPNIDIKSGINTKGLILAIISGIAGILMGGGIVVITLAILGAAISIAKEVMGIFDHKYRASQQKKAFDENIEKMSVKILELVLSNLKDAHNPLDEGIANIKDELMISINHIKSMNQVFHSARTKFELLITKVKKEGEI